MRQDMILVLDLGSEENPRLAREIRALGVYSEIHPHDITKEELEALPNVKGIILNGGPNRVVDGVGIDVSQDIYNAPVPVLMADHKGDAPWPEDEQARKEALSNFVFGVCGAQANWNMENFIADQVELIRRQVGDKKVLLALSGGVDSSVVAVLLIRAVGSQLTCVHVNHGLLRKGEPEQVVQVFRHELGANLIYVVQWTAFWTSCPESAIRSRRGRSSERSSSGCLRKRPESWTESSSWVKAPFILTSLRVGRRQSRQSRAIIMWAACLRIWVSSW